ncbi:RT0821/Lpp0805 family surface protein [uncultured Alsobacter sp.]|uniref:RT0821/Lpp0805 family surface protein n=1 Tax=uncultured Alsobacter sp. TaxID=1748258 RepID=UPI0025FA2D69|nr:RT0821/Lpp0805 family surface protein [uncultured Alsobacter sp.]
MSSGRGLRIGAAAGAVLAAGVLSAGCSINLPLGPFSEPELTTGSIVQTVVLSEAATGEDLVIAGGALDQALDPVRKGAVRWSNPSTGNQGSFLAEGDAYVRDDQVCRSFRAAIVVQQKPDDLRGVACRAGAGSWSLHKVKSIKDEPPRRI